MRRHLLLTALLSSLLMNQAALAGFDEGLTAYNKGNYPEALKQWRPLAEQGNAAAQNRMGNMYFDGTGIPRDYHRAFTWYRKAAEQGDADAQTELGVMHEKGQGVPKDYVLAYMMYTLSATGGEELGRRNREGILRDMTPRQIEEAQTLTRTWKGGTPLPTKSKTGQLK